ncbi:22168_t:CDS:2, partial [Racocetra persica]
DDQNNNTIAYCKICIRELDKLDELDEIQASPYPYSKSGKSTEHLITHLRTKYHINSRNYKRYIDDDNESIIITNQEPNSDLNLPSLSSEKQRELTKLVVEFIVYNVQPLHILKNPSFHKLLRGFKPQYQVPSVNKLKKYLSEAYSFVEQIVGLLKPFEEITRYICESNYPILNLVYPYIHILKNKFALISEKGELLESWLDLIYGLEKLDTTDKSSLSSDNEADILSARNWQQWQYTYRKYLPPANCSRLLEKARAAIFLSLDELWSTSDEIGLKVTSSNSEEMERNKVTTNEDLQDSLSAKLWRSCSISDQDVTEDEFTHYMKEPI